MNKSKAYSRRYFIKSIGALSGGLLLACDLSSSDDKTELGGDKSVFIPNLFVELQPNGLLILTASRSEMGQGVRTSLTSVIADEMDADWSKVKIRQAPGDDAYGNQNTDGSRSIRTIYEPMRKMGAMARNMLIAAAANRWKIPVGSCKADRHYIVRTDNGEKIFFGDLATEAANMDIPENPKLKSPEEFIYIGKGLRSVDASDFVRGRSNYGMDVKVENMAYACIQRCPVTFGSLQSFDDTEAMKIPGMISVQSIERMKKPFGALGGVAAIASNSWAAMEGKKALKTEWDFGDEEQYSTDQYMDQLTSVVHKRAKLISEEGNVSGAFDNADQVIEATYQLPHLVHAPMEVPNATADVREGFCEVWAPVQAPQTTRKEISDFLGIELKQVTVHVTLLGGGFGRKSKPDFVLEAVALSQLAGQPVQVIWEREDDIQNSYYHAISAQYLKSSLKNGKVSGWLHRSAFPSITSTFVPGTVHGAEFEFQQGMTNMPFEVENKRFENGEAPAHVRIGWFRSVYNIIHGFSVNVFADELAVAANSDPLNFRLELIGSNRIYPSPIAYALDTSRLKNVLKRAASNAGWGKEMPSGHGLGLAVHYSFYTYVATIIEVSVIEEQLKVHEIFTVVDCGTVVNRDTVKAQMEGAAIFGMSLSYYGEITLKDGRVQQGNYHDYKLVRIHQAPKIHIEIIESQDLPTGIGEPGVPVIAPAIVNAIYDATGKRYRSLPLQSFGLVK